MTISHLSTRELADRWNISRRTLDRWRWAGEGPRFLKLGGRVVYRIADIEAFEEAQLRSRTDLPVRQSRSTPPGNADPARSRGAAGPVGRIRASAGT